MGSQPLTAILSRLRRRLFAVDGLAGLLWGFAGALLWLGVGVWLDLMLELPPWLRIGCLMSSVAIALILMAAAVRRAVVDGTFQALAHRLDLAAGSAGQILSGVDLSQAASPASHSANVDLTNGLARLAIRQATDLAATVPGRQVVSTHGVRRSFGTLALAVCVGVAVTLLLPRLAATEWRRFTDPFGDHPPFSNTTFDVQPGNAKVVYGTGLEIHVTVHGTGVDGVELVMQSRGGPANASTGAANGDVQTDGQTGTGEEVLPLFPEADSRWRATVANVIEPFAYYVRARGARSAKFDVDVITVPRIEGVTYRLTPPAYTRMPSAEGPVPEAGLTGLPGAMIEISARSNRNLSKGKLTYQVQTQRTEVALAPVAKVSDTVTGAFRITGSGKAELRVIDEDGQASTDSWSTGIIQLVDERPFVRLIEPPAMSFATPTATVSAVVSAEDDYGIARLELFRSLNDSRSLPMSLPVADPPTRQTFQVVELKLAEYGLEPGDEIKLFARVEDNDPLGDSMSGRGKGAESSIVVIRIISQEEFDRALQQRQGMESMLAKYQQIRRRMEALAQKVEELKKKAEAEPGNEQAQAELRKAMEELAKQMEADRAALEEMRKQPENFALEQKLDQDIEKLEKALSSMGKQCESVAKNPSATNQELKEALEKMMEELKGERDEFEKEAMQPVEMLAQMLALKQDESTFVELYRRQRDLADRLASLKGRDHEDDPALKSRMRDLETEQKQIREDLDALLTDIAEHAARLPETEEFEGLRKMSLEFAEAVRESGAETAMTDSESGLAEFIGTKAHQEAKRAADILEKFISKCNSMGGQAGGMCKSFRPSIGDMMAQSLDELMQMGGMKDGPGNGMAAGGQGGYSARRNTGDNVGLYGNAPALSGSDATGNSGSSNRIAAGQGRGGARQQAGDDSPSHQSEAKFRATSGSDAAVPLRYRRQTGRYFQRLADELGEK